jgi:hypothetical protein
LDLLECILKLKTEFLKVLGNFNFLIEGNRLGLMVNYGAD